MVHLEKVMRTLDCRQNTMMFMESLESELKILVSIYL